VAENRDLGHHMERPRAAPPIATTTTVVQSSVQQPDASYVHVLDGSLPNAEHITQTGRPVTRFQIDGHYLVSCLLGTRPLSRWLTLP
jgi:hypothetical protein